MQIKVFTLRFSKAIEGFDDELVRAFMADKDIIAVDAHFFFKGDMP